MYRASVEIPYPEPFTAKGEGVNKKDAEKRASAAACKKLYVSVLAWELEIV